MYHTDQVDKLGVETVYQDVIIEATVGTPNSCQVKDPNTCLKCGKICKSKQGLSVHQTNALTPQKKRFLFFETKS